MNRLSDWCGVHLACIINNVNIEFSQALHLHVMMFVAHIIILYSAKRNDSNKITKNGDGLTLSNKIVDGVTLSNKSGDGVT